MAGGDARRRARHRGRAGRGGRDGLRHRAQHARAALGVRTGRRRSRRPPSWSTRGRRPRASRCRSTTWSRSRSQALVERIDARAGPARRARQRRLGRRARSSSGTRRSGSTTSTRACGCCASAIDTHLITSHFALPLLIARPGRPGRRGDRRHRRVQRRPLPDLVLLRPRQGVGDPHGVRPRRTSCARTARPRWRSRPGWLRSEMMLDAFGVTEDELARRHRHAVPHFAISETPALRRPRGRRARRRPRRARAGTGSRCPAASSPRCTASRTSTAAGPTPGATSSRSQDAGQAGRRHRLPLTN